MTDERSLIAPPRSSGTPISASAELGRLGGEPLGRRARGVGLLRDRAQAGGAEVAQRVGEHLLLVGRA